jgi:hypothetical protein
MSKKHFFDIYNFELKLKNAHIAKRMNIQVPANYIPVYHENLYEKEHLPEKKGIQ